MKLCTHIWSTNINLDPPYIGLFIPSWRHIFLQQCARGTTKNTRQLPQPRSAASAPYRRNEIYVVVLVFSLHFYRALVGAALYCRYVLSTYFLLILTGKRFPKSVSIC